MSGSLSTTDYAEGRRLLARVAGLLFDRRLTELQGGNMSMRVGDAAIVTPTRASDILGWRLTPEDTLVQDLDGAVLIGEDSRVSREIGLHLRLYREYAELGSVFHLHLPEALALASAGHWGAGVAARTTEPFGAAVVILEPDLVAQTEPHDARVEELLGKVPSEAPSRPGGS